MQKTLLSLLGEAKPSRALFTTYTFSISWFETFVLPTLRNYGCNQVDILVDYREARKSTEEASSIYAGTAYRIIPVYMAGTAVFHPKLAYLQGADLDHLVVSSANLTLAGHGKNLEVVDAVTSSREPAVFGEFAEFLGLLSERFEFSPEGRAVLHTYLHRARSIAAKTALGEDGARKAWLVHTLTESAASQFVGLASTLNNPTTLTVLSPYHSPSGAPVNRLAGALGVDDIRIGVHAGKPIAPFDKLKLEFAKPPTFVVPVTKNEDRFPHAKCFELKADDGVLLMTGSVNATGQSLETRANVEVSLVRRLPESVFQWEPIEVSEYEACEFTVAELTATSPSVQATWSADNFIQGLVSPAGDSGTVSMELWDGPKLACPVQHVELKEGIFRVRMTDYINSQYALRIKLVGEKLTATGWVSLEYALSANKQERDLTRASTRLLGGEYHIEDLDTIINWLQGIRPSSSSGAGAPNNAGAPLTPPQVSAVSYDEWQAAFDVQDHNVPPDVARISVKAVFNWLNRDIKSFNATEAGPGSVDARAVPRMRLLDSNASEFEEEIEDDSLDAEDADRDARLEQMLVNGIPDVLAVDGASTIVPWLVKISGSIALKRTLADIEKANERGVVAQPQLYLDAWLTKYGAFSYSDSNRDRLMPFFCAMACAAAHYHVKSSLAAVKEALERVAGGVVSCEAMGEWARMGLQTLGMARIPEEERPDILAKSPAILRAVTKSEELETFIAHVMKDHTNVRIPPGMEAAYKALVNFRNDREGKVFGVRQPTTAHNACPCCGTQLSSADQTTLRATRALICISCNRVIFYGLDQAKLNQHEELVGKFLEIQRCSTTRSSRNTWTTRRGSTRWGAGR